MSEHEHEHRPHPHTVDPHTVEPCHEVAAAAYSTRVCWGAIFAGLFAVLSTSWVLYLLGGAIGVSVADASDSTLIGEGLKEGVIVWMLISAVVAYFVGSAAAARLAGSADTTVGMLHGFTLWSVATTAMVALGYFGFTALLQTGQSFVAATANATVSAASTIGSAAGSGVAGAASYTSSLASDAADSELAETLRDDLSQRAAEAIAAADPEGGAEVTASEVRQSIRDLDDETVEDLIAQLTDEDTEGAAELIASETELSADQAQELIDGVYQQMEETLGDPDNDTSLAGDLRRQLRRQVAGVIASADPAGGPTVDPQEVERALDDLDQDAFMRIATLLSQGKTDQASAVIVEQTELSEAQVNELVTGVTADYQSRFDRMARSAEETANDTVEALSSYSQAVLWSTFAATGLGLAVSVLGGWCGADATRRLYVDRREIA